MDTRVVLTGMLPFVVLAAALLSLPVCFALLRLYRRAVLKGMNVAAGATPVPPVLAPPIARRAPPERLRLLALDSGSAVPAGHADPLAAALRRARSGLWRAAAVHALAGLAYALVMTAGWLLATRDSAVGPVKVALLTWSFLWPAVLAVLLVAAYDPWKRVAVLGGYATVLALLVVLAQALNPALRWFDLPRFWLIIVLPATVLVATFLLRPIRAVGPLVLSFLLMVSLGAQVLLSIAAADDALLRRISAFGFALGMGAHAVFFSLVLLGMLLFGGLGWPLLRRIGRAYEAKRFSDQGLTVGALFLLFGVVQSVGIAFEGPGWILTGLVAFGVAQVVARMGFRWQRRDSGVARVPAVLLLRVFRLGRRSELLFDKLRRHWQPAGGLRMIAGPDLVTTTVEPHQFLAFVSGGLARQFVTGEADLSRRLATLDVAPDPDGRYRIHEFFCRADSWQMTMERLAASSDAVLMDLRSFTPDNQGCLFELGRLLDGVALERVLLLIDKTTHRPFLEATLARLWSELAPDSPNRAAAAPTLRLFVLRSQSEAELGTLIAQLLPAYHARV